MKYTLIELTPPLAVGGLVFLLLDKFCEYGLDQSTVSAPVAILLGLVFFVSIFRRIRKTAHKVSIDELLSIGIAGFLLVFGSFGVHRVFRQRTSPGIALDRIIRIQVLLTSDPISISNGRWVAEGRLIETQSENLTASARGGIVIFGSDSADALSTGAFMEMEGSLEAHGDTAGRNDHSLIFFSRNSHITGWKTRYHSFRHRLNFALLEHLSGSDPDTGSLITALLLGRNTDPGSPVMRRFRDSGCIHLLALSGFHLGMIAIAVKLITKPLVGFSASAIISAIGAVIFLILVGPRPSLFRAVTMYLLWTYDSLRGYRLGVLSYLSTAFIIQIVIFPQSAFTLSFQLSYLALCGLAIGGRVYTDLMRRYLPSKFSAAVGAGLGAQFFTLPVVVAAFGVWRPIGILAALPLTFLTAIAMILGSLRLAFANVGALAVIVDAALNRLVVFIGKFSSPFARVPAIGLSTGLAWIIAVLGIIIPMILVWSIKHGNAATAEPQLPNLNPRLPDRAETCASKTLGAEFSH